MPAPKNNKNATKAESGKSSTWLQVRCTPAQKNGWNRAARADGKTLSKWVIESLEQKKNEEWLEI